MKETTANTSPNIGQIQISDEVLSIIAGTAALEVEGVAIGHGNDSRFNKRSFGKGVKVNVDKDKVSVDVTILVKFGHKVHVVSEEVQGRVKTALETMVGMKVKEVNVSVVGLQLEKAPKIRQKVQKRG